MDLTLTGRLYSGTAIEQKTDTFKFRKFVLEITESVNGNTYTNYVEFQLINNNVTLLEQFQKGQMVTVHFNVKGNLWTSPQGEKKCITNLNCWKIGPAQYETQAAKSAWGQPAQPAQPHPAPVPQSVPQQNSAWGQQPANDSWRKPPIQQPQNNPDDLPF